MAAVASSVEGGGTPPNKNAIIPATIAKICAMGEVVLAAITTVNAPVTPPSSSIPTHTSDQPLQQQQQQQQQQNES